MILIRVCMGGGDGWQVYCSGDLLASVQLAGIFEDSKEFVDMPMLDDPENILNVSYSSLL